MNSQENIFGVVFVLFDRRAFSFWGYYHVQSVNMSSLDLQRSDQQLVAFFRRDDNVTFTFGSSHNWINKLKKLKRLLKHNFFHAKRADETRVYVISGPCRNLSVWNKSSTTFSPRFWIKARKNTASN